MPMSRRCTGTVLDLLAVEGDRAVIGHDEAGDGAQQGRLAGARGAEQAEELAVIEGDGDVVERRDAAVALAHMLDLDAAHRLVSAEFVVAGDDSMRPMETTMMMDEMALISGVKPLRIAV